jgi:hypothetical protein
MRKFVLQSKELFIDNGFDNRNNVVKSIFGPEPKNGYKFTQKELMKLITDKFTPIGTLFGTNRLRQPNCGGYG